MLSVDGSACSVCPLSPLSHTYNNNKTNSFGQVNYEDPNYAVGLPVFCIHGNHDDPSREGATEVNLNKKSDIVCV